ncbi:PPK2 family polyphosphate kinase [Aureivirga sp. CE67]|uniref:PPK2 family polyphosphate kinase n=1 Tax=Aureivirga sp. CE67 TaxID=1788983 RepID=UPI0018C9F71C|nr:PPK2 family polyphosphate kinase [Aureivirga sp. CE67]
MKKLKHIPTKPKESISRDEIEAKTEELKEQLFKLQDVFYASKKYSLLIILQGMDTAGKDGTVRHVFSCLNPQGCTVKSFKVPTEEEASHDFLWRIHKETPAKGMFQIFNRSQYEDILVPTVHELLEGKIIEKRYEKINHFESHLKDNDTIILKFFLHISLEEQKHRIEKRLENPDKKWKYSPDDSKDEKYWNTFQKTYEKVFKNCGKPISWEIIPADEKWYRNYLIAKKVVEALEELNLEYPK